MHDSDEPIVGRFGDREDEINEGSLLFDPSSAPDPDDLDPDDAGRGTADATGTRAAWVRWAIGGVAIALIGGVFAFRATRAEPDPTVVSPTLPPMVNPLPSSGTLVITPLPDSVVRGPIGSQLLVGFRVVRTGGGPVGDTVVTFSVLSGGATLRDAEARTTADGLATTMLTFPARPGRTVVTGALSGGEVATGRMAAIAVAGVPETMTIREGNRQEGQAGQLLPTRPVVLVTDADGNPVPDVPIRFRVVTGEGLTAPSSTTTDSTGQASALWRLGMETGQQTLVASSPVFPGTVTFNAMAAAVAVTNNSGPRPLETEEVTVVRASFEIGGSHACSISGGLLTCRGGNDRGQLGQAGTAGFVAVTAGASHTCGLRAEGIAACWGANDAGQLGDGTTTSRAVPINVRTELRFSTLTAGSAHTCGLAGGGVPLCWGQNLSGQLGDGTRNDQTSPRTVGGGIAFVRLAAGWNHTCGLTSNGNAFCWGLNSQGQLGDGSRLDRLTPTLVRGSVDRLAAGSSHTCGVSQRQVLCWGGNTFGQLGDGTTQDRPQPGPVAGLPGGARDVVTGAAHSCALLIDGRAYCWGQNLQGQLGDGTTTNRPTPTEVAGDLRFAEISAGGAMTCGRTVDGVQYCWGLNQSGQLGDGTRANRSRPTQVGD